MRTLDDDVADIIREQRWHEWPGDLDSLKREMKSKCDVTIYFTALELLHIEQRPDCKPHPMAIANPHFGAN